MMLIYQPSPSMELPNCKRPSRTGPEQPDAAHEDGGDAADDETEGWAGASRTTSKRCRRLTPHMVSHLERSFWAGPPKLDTQRKLALAAELHMAPRQVAIWFQNRRARSKTKQLEHNCLALRAKLEDLRAVYRQAVVERNHLLQHVQILGGDSNAQACGADDDDDPQGRIPAEGGVPLPPSEGDATVGGLQHQNSAPTLVACGGPSAQSTGVVASALPPLAVPGDVNSAPPVNGTVSCLDQVYQDGSYDTTSADSFHVRTAPVARQCAAKIDGRDVVPRSCGTSGGRRSIDSATPTLTCSSSISSPHSQSSRSGASLDVNYANSGCASDIFQPGSTLQPGSMHSILHTPAGLDFPSLLMDDELLQGVALFHHDFMSDERTTNHDRPDASLWEWLDVVI